MNSHIKAVGAAIADAGGQTAVARATGKSQPTVHKWTKNGLPKSDWTGESNHADAIVALANANPNRSQDWTQGDLVFRLTQPLEADHVSVPA